MIRDILTVCSLLVAIIAPAIIIDAYTGDVQGPAAEEPGQQEPAKEERIYATDPFKLEPGLAIVKMTHQGKANFLVDLLSARQEEITGTSGPIEFSGDKNGGSDTEVATALADKVGSVAISRAVNVPVGGKHLLDVRADGPWTIDVEQPHPSSASKTASFSGNSDTATPFFQLTSGVKQVTITNPLKGALTVNLLDREGHVVAPALQSQAAQADRDPQGTTSFTLNVHDAGIYLLDIKSDGLWTVDITDAG